MYNIAFLVNPWQIFERNLLKKKVVVLFPHFLIEMKYSSRKIINSTLSYYYFFIVAFLLLFINLFNIICYFGPNLSNKPFSSKPEEQLNLFHHSLPSIVPRHHPIFSALPILLTQTLYSTPSKTSPSSLPTLPTNSPIMSRFSPISAQKRASPPFPKKKQLQHSLYFID